LYFCEIDVSSPKIQVAFLHVSKLLFHVHDVKQLVRDFENKHANMLESRSTVLDSGNHLEGHAQ